MYGHRLTTNGLDDDKNNGKEAGAGTLGIFITLAAHQGKSSLIIFPI